MKLSPIALAALAILVLSCQSRGKPSIGVAFHRFDDEAMSALRRSIELGATDRATLAIVDGQNQQALQNSQIAALLDRKVQALLIDLVDRGSAGVVVEMAKAKSVPVVFFGREPLPEALQAWDRAYFVGSMDEEAATLEGRILADRWLADPRADRNRDGAMQFILLAGEPGRQETLVRSDFAAKAISAAGIDSVALAQDSAHGNRIEASQKMTRLISRFGSEIEAVICNDDDMALGAIDALNAAGYFAGRAIPVVGIGSSASALAAVADGTLAGAVFEDAEGQAAAMLDLALALAEKASIARRGLALVDGKYLWIPHKILAAGDAPKLAASGRGSDRAVSTASSRAP